MSYGIYGKRGHTAEVQFVTYILAMRDYCRQGDAETVGNLLIDESPDNQ